MKKTSVSDNNKTSKRVFSESESSDRRSSSSSDSTRRLEQRKQRNEAKSSSRASRAASSKKYDDEFDYLDSVITVSDSDEEWNEKDAKSSGSDSDPVWSPAISKTNFPSPAKSNMNKTSKSPLSSPSSAKIIKVVENVAPSLKSNTTMDGFPAFAGYSVVSATALEKSFESGKFIMAKSDYKTQKSPCIWRIDGKNLLQKYELIGRDEVLSYRNISTYSSWSISSKSLYVPIEVEFNVHSKSETIVTFDPNEVLLPVESSMLETLNEEANSMVDTFQIYLQTLISQALDSNFLSEIEKEKDEYFLESISNVEDHWIWPRKDLLKDITTMRKPFLDLVETYPGLDLRVVTSGDKKCEVCSCKNPVRTFDFQPLTYSFKTLQYLESKTPSKSYRCCLACTDRVLQYHQLHHIRYHLFLRCKDKIGEYDRTDGPAALKACLADQHWKSHMHRRVLLILAETQQTLDIHRQQQANAA